MNKGEIIEKIKSSGLMAVIRADNMEQALKIAEACAKGGIAALEVTFTVPGAAGVIEKLAGAFNKSDGIIIGAGTVLDPETARSAILAGARFLVSPCLNVEMVRLGNRYQVPVIPGTMTVKEIVEAMEAGAELIKVFPGELLGPLFIKAVKGPLPYAQLMPTGGVSLGNVGEWIKAGAVAVGVGGNLTAGAKTGDYASITEMAKAFIERIKQARTQ
ncbi:MAG: bifunctional 2-keto-4-hydroxyglutarate aldolase/2-keto-3-deoxy-6-phosphogluconate aldolase [Peptococcaceae bacterium]|nr:bifunctional 2-keto-4-hydroxyglutarate aldolase/2-keto-3-deoxy-6-phosphogluconate aldolase [Peptococcaceae bacterium]MDH7524408.1 bifunctional 2-keto-4-hydroxyglutarate aldolase/2-keto-3-deoxy-6-phosphogluconate aldolase [Peptococcaceae bacterium]